MVTSDDLTHLSSAAREVALMPDDIRIDRVLSDRFINYTRAAETMAKLGWYLRHPKKLRMGNLLIISPTNNGKTVLCQKFCRIHPPVPTLDGRGEVIPVLRVQMPSAADPYRFWQAILAALGASTRRGHRLGDKEWQAIHELRQAGVRMLILDELANILAGPSNRLGEMLNMLKNLGNELQIPLIGCGTREALQVVASDDQLSNRFERFVLPRWKDDDELRALLIAFESALPLRRPSNLDNPAFTRRILAMSEGILGEIAALITRAGELAITSGEERIDVSMLDTLDFETPSERRTAAPAGV